MEVELIFGIEISDKEIERLATFGDIAALVSDLTRASPH